MDYLLSATVRWAKAADGTSRVQVVPELIDARTGDVTWQQSYDANLTDVFQVQTQIASRVAGALGVALGSREKTQLAERPTDNLAAYDLYLKGRATSVPIPPAIRRAVAHCMNRRSPWTPRSPTHGPSFAVLGSLYVNSIPDPDRRPPRDGRGRAGPSPRPRTDSRAISALARYYLNIKSNTVEAKRHSDEALRLAPDNPEFLALAGLVERTAGRWEEAVAHGQQALRLDPRSVASRGPTPEYLPLASTLPRGAGAERSGPRPGTRRPQRQREQGHGVCRGKVTFAGARP